MITNRPAILEFPPDFAQLDGQLAYAFLHAAWSRRMKLGHRCGPATVDDLVLTIHRAAPFTAGIPRIEEFVRREQRIAYRLGTGMERAVGTQGLRLPACTPLKTLPRFCARPSRGQKCSLSDGPGRQSRVRFARLDPPESRRAGATVAHAAHHRADALAEILQIASRARAEAHRGCRRRGLRRITRCLSLSCELNTRPRAGRQA